MSGPNDSNMDARLRGHASVSERRWAILQAIEQNRWMSVHDLKDRFNLSEVSIRRDLDYLARQGLIQRVHGGAQATARSGQSGIFEARLLRNHELKRAIAAEAVKLIEPGDRLLLDSGTTVLEVARAIPSELRDQGELTVMTRSLSIASELRDSRNVRLLVLGGLYSRDFDSFSGEQVERALEDLHVDKLIIGADGVYSDRGLTTDNLSEVGLFRTMSASAERVIVVSDSSKIGANYLQTILHFDELDTFVTDDRASGAFLSELREQGVTVIVTKAQAEGGAGVAD